MQTMPPDDVLTRRKFLFSSGKLLVMLSSFSTLACACSPEKEGENRIAEMVVEHGQLILDLNEPRYSALRTIGNGLKIEITRQEKPIIITRVSAAQVAAFSAQCTHAGYEILLPEQGGILACSSGHGGAFDLTGQVVAGPPKSNLPSYPAQLIGNRVHVALFH